MKLKFQIELDCGCSYTMEGSANVDVADISVQVTDGISITQWPSSMEEATERRTWCPSCLSVTDPKLQGMWPKRPRLTPNARHTMD